MTFDTVIMVDWSGGNDRGPSPKKDAIWTCIARDAVTEEPIYHRNRQVAEHWLIATLTSERAAGRRTLVGFDLCFAFPQGFAAQLTGNSDPLALWDWFEKRVIDAPTGNNRFALAGDINAQFPGIGPFWFNASGQDVTHLPEKERDRHSHGLPDKRAADRAAKGAFSPWQLGGAGAVGGQVIMGLPMLSRLRKHFADALSVWPFQNPDRQIVLAETYFSLLGPVKPTARDPIRDAAQVRLYARTFAALSAEHIAQLLRVPATEEGWVLGLGQEEILSATAERAAPAPLTPPPLRNDCFAMPQGAHWTPVEEALLHLKSHLKPICRTESASVMTASGRILSAQIVAKRAHPPQPNSAVDGYGFAGGVRDGAHQFPLVDGRAAAGVPYDGIVPQGRAIRILTGANLPVGVDTVVLQEDVTTDDVSIAFHGPLKPGANTRPAGEDMQKGASILQSGRTLTPSDLATISAAGVGDIQVYRRLRVGILSTGDELRDPGTDVTDGQIFDANRPMLCAAISKWGHEPIDLGRAPDNRTKLREILDDAAQRCDAILTSGGASAGEEDHMSALLQGTGSFALWRIAMKPGRPLALGLWNDTPVFGLPGNPVAAMVCALIFAHPALSQLAGGGFLAPEGYDVPAAFTKTKKDGRREYLRARITDGMAEVFPSEGSGRVSGLSWATGLIELPDHALTIARGDNVRFIPFSGFGL